MARMARVVVPFHPHHITQRGNRRQKTFFNDDDYAIYVGLLTEFCRKADTQVWGYCLMPNHVHFVMVPSNPDGLRAAIGETHRRYTRWINDRENWRGHLWQERFHSFPMDEPYLMATVRYVERNPVAAGLCQRATEWPWSSAIAHVENQDDGLGCVQPMLSMVDDWEAYLSETRDNGIGECISKHSRTGRPLGNNKFVQKLERIVGRRLTPSSVGRKKKETGK